MLLYHIEVGFLFCVPWCLTDRELKTAEILCEHWIKEELIMKGGACLS